MRARDNPFSTDRLHRIRYRFQELGWDEFLKRLEKLDYRAAIVGPEGSGKTTLLEDLEPKLRERDLTPVRLRLTEEAPRFSPVIHQMLANRITSHHILLFDGSEQMSWLAWKRFLWGTRHAGGVIITRHRSGRLPTLHRCATSADLLAEIAGDLLEGRAVLSHEQIAHVYKRNRGNLRGALREFYDKFALGRIALPQEDQSGPLAP